MWSHLISEEFIPFVNILSMSAKEWWRISDSMLMGDTEQIGYKRKV